MYFISGSKFDGAALSRMNNSTQMLTRIRLPAKVPFPKCTICDWYPAFFCLAEKANLCWEGAFDLAEKNIELFAVPIAFGVIKC